MTTVSAQAVAVLIRRISDAENVVQLHALERDVERVLAGDEALPTLLGVIHAKKLRLAGVLAP